MANRNTSKVIQHLRRAVLQDGAGMTDAQLLDCFLSQRDDAAFAALVRRHGPMVWGVCRRVLHNHHDAEDAFQATFLVLVRKAASVEPKELVGNWLYGVAYQTALKARSVAARRKERERQVVEMPEPAVEQREVWNDLQPLLDQELSRLPDKYRVPLVLCDLEGKTRKEAARLLGWPEGTVAGRLATARKMLARRLARRGVALSGGTLAAVLPHNAASGCVPPAVVSSTIQAATMPAAGQAAAAGLISVQVAALTAGVVKTMLLNPLKTATAVLLVVGTLGAGGVIYRTQMTGRGDAQGERSALAMAGEENKPLPRQEGLDIDQPQKALEIDPRLLQPAKIDLRLLQPNPYLKIDPLLQPNPYLKIDPRLLQPNPYLKIDLRLLQPPKIDPRLFQPIKIDRLFQPIRPTPPPPPNGPASPNKPDLSRVNVGIGMTPDLSNAEFRTDAVKDQPVENDPAMEKAQRFLEKVKGQQGEPLDQVIEKARKWLEKAPQGEQNAITIHALLEKVDAQGNTINAIDVGEGVAVRLLLMGRRHEKTPLTELAESVTKRKTKLVNLPLANDAALRAAIRDLGGTAGKVVVTLHLTATPPGPFDSPP